MPKQQQFPLLKLTASEEKLIYKMFDEDASARTISRALRERSGKLISPSSITHIVGNHWGVRQKEREDRLKIEKLVREARLQGHEISSLLRAALLEAFKKTKRDGPFKKIAPLQLESAERSRRELALKEERLLLTGRRVKVVEQRWALNRKQAQAALRKLDRKAKRGQPLTADEARRIREIYEIYDEWQPNPDQTATDEDNGTS